MRLFFDQLSSYLSVFHPDRREITRQSLREDKQVFPLGLVFPLRLSNLGMHLLFHCLRLRFVEDEWEYCWSCTCGCSQLCISVFTSDLSTP